MWYRSNSCCDLLLMVQISCLRDILFLEGAIALIPVKIGFTFCGTGLQKLSTCKCVLPPDKRCSLHFQS